MEFTGGPQRWLYEKALENRIMIINGKSFGVKDRNGNPVLLDTLLGDVDVEYDKSLSGIYINDEQLTKRSSLNWFEKLSTKQVLNSDTLIGKYLLLSNSRFW